MLFFSAERLLGTERALLLAALALLPGLQWPVIQFLDLWRTSLAVGQELLSGALAGFRLVPSSLEPFGV